MHRLTTPVLLISLAATLAHAAPVTQPAADPAVRAAAVDGVRALVVRQPGRDRPDDAASIERLTGMAKRPAATAADVAAADWLDRNREAVVGCRFPEPALPALPDQPLTVREAPGGPNTLYVHVLDHHASGRVIVYGLSGEKFKRAYWLGDPKKDLKVETTPRDTLVELTVKNAKAPDPVATVVAIEFAGGYRMNPLEARPQPDGSVLLHSKEAVVVGKNLRYEPEPHKNTVGYWTNPGDWVYWPFVLEKPGTFDVEMLQGCGKNNGGSEVEVTVGNQPPLPMIVQDTGHFQNFVPRVIGRVKLEPGAHTLAVRVKHKKGGAVMDLRQVTLKPVP